MIPPLTFAEFEACSKESKRVAVFEEIPTGPLTPVMTYSLLCQLYGTDGIMLEDIQQLESPGHSFICFEPTASLCLNHGDGIDPLTALRHLQSEHAYSTRKEVAERITQAAGFMTYDGVRYFEEIPNRHPKNSSLPTLLFHCYALSLAFNHAQQTILISQIVPVSDQPEQDYQNAQKKIQSIIQLLIQLPPEQQTTPPLRAMAKVELETSDSDFMHMVTQAKAYIQRGDAFQIVLSRCFKRPYDAPPLEIYKTLRQTSPSPFMFYFPTQSAVIMGASPERLIRVHNQTITVNPIAGTRKRDGSLTNEAIRLELLNDPKELAEHRMLVDLARNDVGSVSEPGSVQVSELMKVKHYSHVSHITSTVTGQLQNSFDAFDAFAAAFPAGTLSGAPKIRAMEIIDELETSRRELYGGAICRLDSLGNLESCIAIRMAVLQEGMATVRTGAGVVYDSNPASEAQETLSKAGSMLDAIAKAQGESHVVNY